MARHNDATREHLQRRAAFWSGARTVVVDTETTGLNTATARMLSIAILELTEGRTQSAWSRLIDPGLATLGAGHIHNLTTATLHRGGALPFVDAADTILAFLTSREGEPVVLAGHNVLFDALMLHRELSRIGLALPAGLLLLDTRTVARALQLTVGTLAQLAADLKLPVLDAHSAFADANLTANALLLMGDQLAALGTPPDLLDLTVVFDPGATTSRSGTIRTPRNAPPPLSPAHAAAHAAPLRTKLQREKQLAVCVAEGCAELPTRVEDAITRAQQRLIDAYLAPKDDVDPGRAEAFLPFRDPGVSYGRGRPSLGWFGKLRGAGHLDVAGYGVVRAARGPAGARDLQRELIYLRWAWAKGCVGPEVGDALSKLLVQLAPTGNTVTMKTEAIAVCDTALSVRQPTDTQPTWDAIIARRARIQQQLNKPPREPSLHPRNRRPPRQSRYYLGPVEASPLTPPGHGQSTSYGPAHKSEAHLHTGPKAAP